MARAAVIKARKKRDLGSSLSEEYDIEDYLISLAGRARPLRSYAFDLVTAGVRVFNTLWPDVASPTSIQDLANHLLKAEDRLCEWRESAARVGADEALSFVLSWYEGINLDVLQSMRAGSPFLTDPELIKKRQERAYSFVQYGDIHSFRPDPNEDEEEGTGEDEAEEESEDEDVDEEIDADMAPAGSGDRNADTPVEKDDAGTDQAPAGTDPPGAKDPAE